MTTESTATVTTDRSGDANATPSVRPPRPTLSPRRPWLVGALFWAGGAQLITISALLSADPLAATWWALLLAIAPAPLVAVAAFAPAVIARAAAVAAILVLVVGLVAGILHTGLLFLPALVLLVIGSRPLVIRRS
jgi:hypothetical protein